MHQDTYIFQFSTKKNLLIFFITFSIFIGARLNNRGMIAFGIFFFIILLLTKIYTKFIYKGISIQREHYPRCFEGNKINVLLKLSSKSNLPIFMLEIVDSFPPGNEYFKNNLVPHILNKNHHYLLQYTEQCSRKRGLYVLGPIKLFCADPLGVLPQALEITEFTKLLVYPQAVDLQYFNVLWKGTLFHVGLETLLKSGRSEEFTGLRDYQRGDSLNLIHWRSTARHQKLLVKDFREDVQTEVSIFLDLFRLSLSGLGDITTIEYIIKSAASIARISIELGHFVQVFNLSESPEYIPLGSGIGHLTMILDRMTFFKAKGEGSFENLFKYNTTLCKSGSTVVLIAAATNFSHAHITDVLRNLIFRKIRVIVILIDDRTFIKLWKEQEITHIKAKPIEEIAKLLILDGCAVHIIAKDDDLKEKLGLRVETIENVF